MAAKLWVRCVLIVALLALGPGVSSASPSGEKPSNPDVSSSPRDADVLHWTVDTDFFGGPIKGFVQTPAGGSPGSTDRHRPRLGELGIHDAFIGMASASYASGPNELFAGLEFIDLSGSGTLRNDLVTHGVTFPAGTRVRSDVSLDWYRLGYRYRFNFLAAENGAPQLSAAPYVDGVLWNFDYRIRGDGVRTSRGYLKPTVQLGLNASWNPGGGRFFLDADASAGPPGVSSLPFIAAEQLSARYRFIDTGRFTLDGVLGIRFEQLNYYDNQRVSNHIRSDLGPLGVVGVHMTF